MKIHVLGGGPAGLFFAILMKASDARHEITVWERNEADATFGWGVVFSDKTVAGLRQADHDTHQRLTQELRTWENVDIVHRGVLTSVAGNRFSGIARLRLLQVLQERCAELGVRLLFGQEARDPGQADLIVGADGVHSGLRTRLRRHFQPQLTLGRNRYIWYGTRQPFGGLTLIFRCDGPDLFMAHSYKYSQDMSTFIVEVDEPTWQRLRYLGEERARARLQRVFGEDLGGHPLLSNRSRWIRFTNVRNARWWSGNCVLLGDALHTAHFSIGSGTKLAMEDSIALWQAFLQHPEPSRALPAFEAARRPQVERFQQLAATSQHWFEHARERIHLPVLPFAHEVMTRSSRLDDDSLRQRDPAFVAAYEAFMAAHAAPPG